MLEIVGAATVKTTAAEAAPPGFVTVTLTGPALVTKFAGTLAVILVLLENDALSVVLPHLTVAPETKFFPLMVSTKTAAPAGVEFGLRLDIEAT
jgi:hypothetical protein